MQNLLGYGGESYVKQGVIRHYVGDARLSWVDCDDVAAVAAVCLADPEHHAGKPIGSAMKQDFYEVAETFTEVLGQPFSYEPRPPSEFLAECACRRSRTCLHEMRLRQLHRSDERQGYRSR